MNLLAVQITLILFVVFVAGFGSGWILHKLTRRAIDRAWINELTRLRKRRLRLLSRACHYRHQLQQCKLQENHTQQQLAARSDHIAFSHVRQQLETARTQLSTARLTLKQREQHILKLIDLVRLLKTQMHRERQQQRPHQTRQASPVIAYLPDKRHAIQPKQQDDFLVIEGITLDIARKLHQLGITSYRQLAECSPEQQHSMQKLIGKETLLPINRWARQALHLYRQQNERANNAQSHDTSSGNYALARVNPKNHYAV